MVHAFHEQLIPQNFYCVTVCNIVQQTGLL